MAPQTGQHWRHSSTSIPSRQHRVGAKSSQSTSSSSQSVQSVVKPSNAKALQLRESIWYELNWQLRMQFGVFRAFMESDALAVDSYAISR